ncbi:hypothetical protein FM115_03515 [Marinilactibacillus psychrotolerans 42ea]|uniref:Uncharacterized protein n=1 Tax=Marinilactibacillus psychrotolerans 42ea TaxID=1255609 RepID=A0A1R4J1R3_9LACT|nr:hypothetical protein [Marinilactibacillus psychrotolerans]SJN25864.1 hypothetical protein FM115_03515 [Marinilactibacillus psychrotolerans 42ea]
MAGFEPIINKNKSTLQNKQVSIKGSDSFGRIDTKESTDKKGKASGNNEIADSKNDPRLKASKTQKFSPNTTLKINTLKPFLKETESMNTATFNDIVDMLVDNYIQNKLTTRQNEAYKAIYKSQYDML